MKGVRPEPDGHFAITFHVPDRSVGVLMYRAKTKVTVHAGGPADRLTFTLPQPIDTP
jgi:hypothetical protein